jgi:hypothetical protein
VREYMCTVSLPMVGMFQIFRKPRVSRNLILKTKAKAKTGVKVCTGRLSSGGGVNN